MMNMIGNTKLITTVICVKVLFLALIPAHARVVSVDDIIERVGELEDTAEIVKVKCHTSSKDYRLIYSEDGESNWCSGDIPTVCAETKFNAGVRVCSRTFARDVDEYNKNRDHIVAPNITPTQAAPADGSFIEGVVRTEPTKDVEGPEPVGFDTISLEKEQIRIEQDMLELRRKELELDKRRLELERKSTFSQ